MNKKMKKVIGTLFMSLVMTSPAVSFAATLNSDPQDFATLRVVNYTVNSACNSCWGSSASANVGDILSFAIYYHNTGADTATNVRVKISPQTTTSGTTHSFTATVSADNAPTTTGTVVVTTTSNQTISFLQNGVIWRPNQTTYGSAPLPSGQLAGDLFGGLGINIGNVAPGWATQGSVIARFQVSSGTTATNNSAPAVTTNSASSVYQNSATLNGYVTPNGTNTSAWFEWGTSYSFGNSTSYNSYGTNGVNFNSGLNNLNANTTYYYRAVAQNSYGTVYGNTLSFTTTGQSNTYTQPFVSTNSASAVLQNSAVLNGYVTSSGVNINAWFEWGTSYSLGNTTSHLNYGTGATSFNNQIFNLNQNTTYYYRAVAQSSYGTVYGNTLSFITTGQTYNYNTSTGSAPAVTTLLATEKTGTTAKLNGLVATSENVASSAWFEWGTTGSLGNKTSTINVGNLSVVKHSDFITGLASGQTYYYRVVAQNSYGTVYGVVNSFVSEASAYTVTPSPTTVVLKPTTTTIVRGGSVQTPATLSIEGGAEMIGSGEKRTYRVQWKNDSAQELKNVVLRVTFPASMNIDSATKGSFLSADNSVIIDLKNLPKKEGGDAFIFATTKRGLKAGELLVVTANMVYTGTNGAQGDAVAYVMHRAETGQNGSVIGANIFGAGEFVPTTVFEWILLMVLTLVLVLLGNHLYGRFSNEKH